MMIFSNHKEVDGRVLPTRMVVKPLDGSGEYTRVTIKEIKFNVKIGKDFFSIQKLKAI
jgi:outer membrane lipoprotein-sorting protein